MVDGERLRTDASTPPGPTDGAPNAPPALELRAVQKRIGAVRAVDGVSLTVRRGEIVALLGPSGCGKTTTLRLIAGLEDPTEGEVLLDGEVVSRVRPHRLVPPERRRLGFVFQAFALWPHMTVRRNIEFGLRARHFPRGERIQRVARYLALVNLAGYEDRYPNQLSGGQQQRVALARALAYEPRVLLLDEPLSNVDAKDRERLRDELSELLRRLAITTVYVTHDQSEALALADRVVIMDRGRIVEEGKPVAIHERPSTRFGAEFGMTNVLSGIPIAGPGDTVLFTPLGAPRPLVGSLPHEPLAFDGTPCYAAVRPAAIRVLDPGAPETLNVLAGQIEEVEYLGDAYQIVFRAPGLDLRVRRAAGRSAGAPPEVGPGRVQIPVEAIHFFRDPTSGSG